MTPQKSPYKLWGDLLSTGWELSFFMIKKGDVGMNAAFSFCRAYRV